MAERYKMHHHDLPDDLELSGDIAIDSETLGLNIKRDKLCLVQLCDEKGAVHFVKFDVEKYNNGYNAPNLVKLLKDGSRQKIFHFARFDVAKLMYDLKIDDIPNIFCTKIASKLCRTYTDAHGLKVLCKDILNIDLSKESQRSDWSEKTLTPAQLGYATRDVIYLHRLREYMIKTLEKRGRLQLALDGMDCIVTICKIEIEDFDLNVFEH